MLRTATSKLSIGIFAAVLAAAVPACASAKGLEAAAVRTDITPTDLANLDPFGGGAFTQVHDPIFARVLLLQEGKQSALLITVDAPEVGDMVPLRRRIERESGVPFDHILIAATHDHSAPRIGPLSPGTRAQKASAEAIANSDRVYDRILAAIISARKALRPAEIGFARGRLDINVNRDAYVPDKGWVLGFDRDGPSVDDVPVIRIDAQDGKPIAIVFAYGVHSVATFGLKQLSGDLAGAAQRHVETYGDPGVVGMFLMGAAGDQIPIVAQGRPQADDVSFRELAFKAMDAQGLLLGAEVLRVARTVPALNSDVALAATTRDVTCPTKATTGQMATMSTDTASDAVIRLGAMKVGDIALATVGGEVTTPLFRHFVERAPLTKTIFATNVNDRIGYIVEDAAYDRPTFEVKGSPLARGCAERGIVDGLTQMLAELNR